MNSCFIDANKTFISLISSFNLYTYNGENFSTLSKDEALLINHINTEESCYCFKSKIVNDKVSVDKWSQIIKKPACKDFFWPIDIVVQSENEDADIYLVFPCVYVPEVVSLKNYLLKENSSGLENNGIKVIINNLLSAFDVFENHRYLYNKWTDEFLFLNLKNYSQIISFSEFTNINVESTIKNTLRSKEMFYSEYSDPYSIINDTDYDFYSEMYALSTVLFKLLIGRLPYEGAKMDGIPRDNDGELLHWLDVYIKTPIFIFDNDDSRNTIGDFEHEKIFMKRWNSLPKKVKEMFQNVFSESNVMRKNEQIFYYKPSEWIDALKSFDFTLGV